MKLDSWTVSKNTRNKEPEQHTCWMARRISPIPGTVEHFLRRPYHSRCTPQRSAKHQKQRSCACQSAKWTEDRLFLKIIVDRAIVRLTSCGDIWKLSNCSEARKSFATYHIDDSILVHLNDGVDDALHFVLDLLDAPNLRATFLVLK